MIDVALIIRITDWCQRNGVKVEDLTQEELEEAIRHKPAFTVRCE